jgi:4-amino-4-deoxy-L-arabinose transferase-like glycosyltransferase
MKVFGDNAFAARFPSAVAMLLVLGLLALVLDHWLGPIHGAGTVLVMASSALTIMSAKMCLTDAVLLLWITIALLGVFAVYRGNRSWWITLLIWIPVGLAGLTKGPIVLAVLLATLAVLTILDWIAGLPWNIRWWLALRPWIGILIIAAICAPWLWLVHRREPRFLAMLVGRAEAHLGGNDEKHAAPPGFYLATIWGLFFPWSMLLPLVLVISWKNRRVLYVRYSLAILLGVWIFQECMKTKLPFYMLPTFPALSLLTADALLRCMRGEYDDLMRKGFIVASAIWAVAICIMAAAIWGLAMPRWGLQELLPYPAMVILSLAALIYAAVVFGLFLAHRFTGGFAAMGIGSLAIFALIFTCFLPQARFLQVSQQLAAILRQHGATQAGDVIMINYKEPSLAFYQGGTIVEERLGRFFELTPPSQWPRWAVLPKSDWQAMMPDVRNQLRQVGPTIHGLDYAGKIDGHRVVDVVVINKKDTPAVAIPPGGR